MVASLVRLSRGSGRRHRFAVKIVGRWMITLIAWAGLARASYCKTIPTHKIETLKVEGAVCGCAAADVNGDDRKDVLVFYTKGDADLTKYVAAFVASTSYRYNPKPDAVLPLDAETAIIGIDDLDGDGLTEIVACRSQLVQFYHWDDTTGQFGLSTTLKTRETLVPDSTIDPVVRSLFADLNDDGLKDLILPNARGYAVFLQDQTGFPSSPTTVVEVDIESGVVVDATLDSTTVRFSLPRLVLHDLDGDGVDDILLASKRQVAAASGTSNGTFPLHTYTFDVPLEFHEEWMVFYNAEDFNGDGNMDLFYHQLSGTSISKVASEVSIFLGKSGPEFPAKPDHVFADRGGATLPFFLDVDANGSKDLVLARINLGVSFFLNYLLRHKVSFEIEARLVQPDGTYAEKPSLSTKLSFDVPEAREQPIRAGGDFDGDGLLDFAFATGKDTVAVFLGEKGRLFSGDPDFEVSVEAYGNCSVADIDRNAAKDLLISYERGKKENCVRVVLFAPAG